jgi:hypothetical protein
MPLPTDGTRSAAACVTGCLRQLADPATLEQGATCTVCGLIIAPTHLEQKVDQVHVKRRNVHLLRVRQRQFGQNNLLAGSREGRVGQQFDVLKLGAKRLDGCVEFCKTLPA